MKIGIFADLHGNIEAFHTIMGGVFKDVDAILCAGDTFGAGRGDPFSPWFQPQKLKDLIIYSKIPITMVYGNCDPKGLYPDSATGTINGLNYYLCHGQHCPDDDQKLALAKEHTASLLIYGHTHEWRLEKKDGVIIINPGSPTMPKKKPQHDTVALLNGTMVSIIDIHSQEALSTLHLHT
jgi:putative phosphoesterase